MRPSILSSTDTSPSHPQYAPRTTGTGSSRFTFHVSRFTRHSSLKPILLALCFVLAATHLLAAAPAKKLRLPAPAKLGVYLGGSRVGQMTVKAHEDTFEGKKIVRIDSDLSFKVAVLGEVEQTVRLQEY